MQMRRKRIVTGAVTAALAAGLLAGCGSSSGKGDSAKNTITIFNSKMEIQDQMEKMAEEYSKEKGVKVEVYYSSDTVSAHLATRYASNEPYTISMVDAKDVYSLAAEHALDLSDQDWVDQTEQEIAVDGKVYGFPVCIEARGIIYNADAIKKVTGKDFDPAKCATTDEFKALIEELKKGGMETPVGVMKEDWSLAGHYLPQVYEEQADPEAFVQSLYKGEAKLAENPKWTSLMDTFDVLKDNNYAKDAAISAERELTEQKLAEGEIAFMFGGNWDWSVLNAYSPSENMGMMPVPQNTQDASNTKLVGGGSKYLFIDSSDNTSEEQQKAAKEFLSWLVNEEAGQKFLVEQCALVPAFKNNTLPVADPLGKSVKEYADAGKLIDNYNYLPDDHYSVLGAVFQKYLAGQTDRAGLAKEIESYWSTVKPVEH